MDIRVFNRLQKISQHKLGWISIQNEPDYTATWETCIYMPEQLRDLVKAVSRKFSIEGITTKIVVPETSAFTAPLII